VASTLHTERAHQVDAPLRTPSAPYPVLVSLPLPRPGVRGGQAQVEATLVEVFQDDLAFGRPLLRSSRSSLALRSCSGLGALLGT
jgi:hypothetical protein